MKKYYFLLVILMIIAAIVVGILFLRAYETDRVFSGSEEFQVNISE